LRDARKGLAMKIDTFDSAMNPLEKVEWLEPLVEPRSDPELERWVMEQRGSLDPHTPYFADCPWIIRADVRLDAGYIHINDLMGLVYLTISRDNSCRFCYGASRLLMRLGGLSDADIERLERDIETAAVAPRTRLALDYARRVSRCNPPPAEVDRQALLAVGFDATGVKELGFWAADVVFHNRFATLLALPPFAEQITDKSLFARLRDDLKQLFAQTATPAKPESLTDDLKSGPYSDVVLALDGLVQARILRTVIDDAWASTQLRARTKALIFAVIARGLGSAAAEREARRLLAEEGLRGEQVERAITHLSSSGLDAAEARILPYVRETIWVQAPSAQRRSRDLRGHLSAGQFLETVGIAALANMICRLALVLEVA
jgi:hypothetical protein